MDDYILQGFEAPIMKETTFIGRIHIEAVLTNEDSCQISRL